MHQTPPAPLQPLVNPFQNGLPRPLLRLLLACGLAALLLALYWQGLHGDFFFDDAASILTNPDLRLPSLQAQALLAASKTGVAGLWGRPLAQLSFALNHYASGFDPFAFKLTNLAVHAAVGWLVYCLGRRLDRAPLFAPLLAALWLLHPIQMTSVLYVVQRMTSLSALFLLAGLLLHMRARSAAQEGTPRSPRLLLPEVYLLAAWGVCWPLAVLCKETALLFPVLVLAWELTLRRQAHGGLDGFARALGAVLVLALAAALAYGASKAGQWLWSAYQGRSFTAVERVLTEGRVLWLYLELIVLPRMGLFGLYHDDITVSTSLWAPWTTAPACLGILLLLVAAWTLRRRQPLLAFGIAWFLVGHGLESTVLPLELAHEHRNYLPSMGVLLVLAKGLSWLWAHRGWRRTLATTVAAGALAYCAMLTALRSDQYADPGRSSQIEVQYHPLSARAQYEAGRAVVALGGILSTTSPAYAPTRAHYEQAGHNDPHFKWAALGLIHLDCMAGAPSATDALADLLQRLRHAPFGPGDRNVLLSVKDMAVAGSLCLPRPDVEALFAAADANPTATAAARASMLSWLADYQVDRAHDRPAALRSLAAAWVLQPGQVAIRLKQLQLQLLEGQYDTARQLLAELDARPLGTADRALADTVRRCLQSPAPQQACAIKDTP